MNKNDNETSKPDWKTPTKLTQTEGVPYSWGDDLTSCVLSKVADKVNEIPAGMLGLLF